MNRFQLLLAFLAVSALLVALAVPLMRRRVKPNDLYGLRVEATFADEHVWYEANAASGRDLALAGVIQSVVASVLFFLPIHDSAFAAVQISILLTSVVALCVAGIRRANRMLAERTGTSR